MRENPSQHFKFLVNHSVGAIIYHKGKYLLQKRDNKKDIYFPGLWGVFGGDIKKGEKEIFSLKRELKEELNLNFVVLKKIFTLKIRSKNFNPARTRHYFLCRLPLNYKKDILLREGRAYKFFSLKKIDSLKIIPWDFAMMHYHYFTQIKKRKIIPNNIKNG